MAEQMESIVRGVDFQAEGTPRVVGCDELGGLLSSQLSPSLFNLARCGKIFAAKHTVATAVAPLQVVPTTTAAAVLYNPAESGKMLVMLKCGVYLGSGTSGIGLAVFGGVTGGALATALTADGSGVTRSQGLGAGQSSVAFMDFSKTVVAGWTYIGGLDSNPAAAVPGTGRDFDLNGAFIVRPTYAFHAHTVAGAGTSAAYCFSFLWAEVNCTVDY
jgi:hypothetical protein